MNKFQGVDSGEGSFTLCYKAIDQRRKREREGERERERKRERERERERERGETRTNKDVVRKSSDWHCGHTCVR